MLEDPKDEDIFSYEKLCEFHNNFLSSHHKYLIEKIEQQEIITRLQNAPDTKQELRIEIASIALKAFNINVNSQLSEILHDKHEWNNYMDQCDTLPPLDMFLDKIDQYSNVSLDTQANIDGLAYEIAYDTTLFLKTRYGTRYAAEFSNKSFFITLSDVQHKDTEESGWKFHISLSREENNISMAWDIVKDILIQNEAPSFKIIAPNMPAQYEQVGKQITIYHFKNSHHDWHSILQQIESALTERDIKSSDFNELDKQIEGSKYITYRNDKGPNSEYIPAEYAKTLSKDPEKWYNLSGKGDLFHEFVMEKHQTQTLRM